MAQLGVNLSKQEKWAEVESIMRQCLAVREKVQPDAWNTFSSRSMLGGSLLGLGWYAEAEPLITSGYEGLKARNGDHPARRASAYIYEASERVVRLYEAWGKPELAKEWKARLGAEPDTCPPMFFARLFDLGVG